MWGKAELPPPTTPLVNTMDHTLFDYIYHTESTPELSIPEGVLELQQVPATNLTPPQKETAPTEPLEVEKTQPIQPPPSEEVTPHQSVPPKSVEPEPEEFDDDIDEVRIVPNEDDK